MKAMLALTAALALPVLVPATVVRLGNDHQPLVRDFANAAGKVRLLAILSPT